MITPVVRNENAAFRFSVGDRVQILVGPFEGFNATIKTIDNEKHLARVFVHVFIGLSSDPFPEFSFDDLKPDPEDIVN